MLKGMWWAGVPDRKRGGRPPRNPEDRLTEVIRFRLTVAEADALYRHAARERTDLAPILRRVVNGITGFRGPETSEVIH